MSITLYGSLSAADETCGETDCDDAKDADRTTNGTTESGDVAWFGGGAGEIERRLVGDRRPREIKTKRWLEFDDRWIENRVRREDTNRRKCVERTYALASVGSEELGVG